MNVFQSEAPKNARRPFIAVRWVQEHTRDRLLQEYPAQVLQLSITDVGSGDGCDAASVASTNGVARRWGGIKGMGRPEPASSSSAGPAGSCSGLSCRPRPGRGGSMVHLIQVNGHRRRRRQ
jgi:hypothetical protein